MRPSGAPARPGDERRAGPRGLRWVVLVCAAVVVAAAAGAGAFAPVAAAAPDAAQIDAYLAEHQSPMTGMGATFVAEGNEHGVNPAFLVAISGAETSFGQLLFSQDGDQCTYNAFNWFYAPTRPQSDFASWGDGIARVAEGLSGPTYYGAGLYSVSDIGPRYCPDGTDNWIRNVDAFLGELGGDPADTRVAAVAPPVPSVQPGLVALDGHVMVLGKHHEVGRHINMQFVIVNQGGQTLTVDGIRLAVRGPGTASADMVSRAPVTLQPGASRIVQAAVVVSVPGEWHGWIEAQQNGTASLVGAKRAYTFTVVLPRDPGVRRWVLRDQVLNQPY